MKRFLLLLPILFGLGTLSAQVGINNPTPSQALDVGGKIKVGDDAIAPVAGTIRYNRVTKTFEGYDGAEWSVFNPNEESNEGTIPPSGSLVAGDVELNPISSNSRSIFWKTVDGQVFNEVPPGRTLYVTSVIISANSGSGITLYPENEAGAEDDKWGLSLNFSEDVESKQFTEASGTLIAVNSGSKLTVTRGSSLFVTVFLRGYIL